MAFTLEETILNFWSRVTITDTCWLWDAPCKSGYGSYWFQGRCWLAHRVAWHIIFGDLSKGKSGGDNCVCHTCDNRGCVRPSHLFIAPQTENIRDAIRKGRNRGAKGVRNCKAKLTPVDVDAIRATPWKYGHQIALARKYGVSTKQIRSVVLGESWS